MTVDTYTPNPKCSWVTVTPAQNPAFPRWNVASLEYRDAHTEPQSDGACNIYVNVFDQFGSPLGGVEMCQAWADGVANKVTDKNGKTDFFMSPDSNFDPAKGQVGAYSIYTRFKDYPTATAQGFGLPLKQHVEYRITFQLALSDTPVVTPPPPPPPVDQTLEQAVMDAAHTVEWMPINNQGALWKFAKANNLEDAQTDEINFTWQNNRYVLQVFNLGIVYAKLWDWSNIKVIPK